nr:RNA-directed DNA polymerase, eukaryota [Tanacetum cinerariifolium]
GLWVWTQFNSEKSCRAFRSNESLKKLWITSQEVSPSFVVDERMIWIEICGLILYAWGSKSNDYDDEDISSNRNVDPIKALDDFIQHVVEEKEVEKTPPKDPKADDSKPPSFEKGSIYNNDDVASQAGTEDVSFFTDQNFIKENKACSQSCSTSRSRKCSTYFSNYSRKNLKGFSFIDEMNQMIEVGGALGYDVKGCKNFLMRLINDIDMVKEKGAAISDLEKSKPLHSKRKDLKSHLNICTLTLKRLRLTKNYILATLRDLDKNINDAPNSDLDRTTRINRMQELEDLEKLESIDLDIKSAFLDFYKDKFSFYDSSISIPSMLPAHRLSIADQDFLESMLSMDEIMAVVWDCGSHNAPGSDGYSFMFIKKFWDLLKHDIQSFVVCFFFT